MSNDDSESTLICGLDGAPIENIHIDRTRPNAVQSVYKNEHYYVTTANSELMKEADGSSSIINSTFRTSEYKPYEINTRTKQTVHTDGTYSNYQMCYNPETGMDEFVRIGGGTAPSANIIAEPQFNAVEGVERYKFKGLES